MLILATLLVWQITEARVSGARSVSRPSVSRASVSSPRPKVSNVRVNKTVNVNKNTNVNKNVNVNKSRTVVNNHTTVVNRNYGSGSGFWNGYFLGSLFNRQVVHQTVVSDHSGTVVIDRGYSFATVFLGMLVFLAVLFLIIM